MCCVCVALASLTCRLAVRVTFQLSHTYSHTHWSPCYGATDMPRPEAPSGPEPDRTGGRRGEWGAAGPFDTPPFGWAFGVMRRAPTPQPRRYTSTVAETQHMRTECMRVCMVPNQSPWLDGRVNMESLARFMDIPAAHGACQLSVCMAAAINHRHGVARDGRCKVPCDCSMATR